MQKEAIAHLAELSRLAPDSASQERFARQCGEILNYMDILNQVDTEGVAPLYSPCEAESFALRPDVAVLRKDRDALLSNAPQTDGAFFVVPRIV